MGERRTSTSYPLAASIAESDLSAAGPFGEGEMATARTGDGTGVVVKGEEATASGPSPVSQRCGAVP